MKSKIILISLGLLLSITEGYQLKSIQKSPDEDQAMAALEQAINAEAGDEASTEVEGQDEKEAPAASVAAAPAEPQADEDEAPKKVDDLDSLMDKYDKEEEDKKFTKTDKFKEIEQKK